MNQVLVYQTWRAFDPGTSFPIEMRFAAMPALTKQDIREHFPDEMLPGNLDIKQALINQEIELVNSRGTSGDQITNIWNQTWWDASERAS